MKNQNGLSEKQRIEKATAELFLKIYNAKFGTGYQIQELSDTPDVICIDKNSDEVLKLEISLLEDLPGDVPYQLGRNRKPISPTTRTTAVSFWDDTVKQLQKSLENKLLARYDSNTALVLRQVSILWEPEDWEVVAHRFRNGVLVGKENNYGKGVWIICTDNSTWPVSDTIFCLSKPEN